MVELDIAHSPMISGIIIYIFFASDVYYILSGYACVCVCVRM